MKNKINKSTNKPIKWEIELSEFANEYSWKWNTCPDILEQFIQDLLAKERAKSFRAGVEAVVLEEKKQVFWTLAEKTGYQKAIQDMNKLKKKLKI